MLMRHAADKYRVQEELTMADMPPGCMAMMNSAGDLEKFGTQGVPVHETHAIAWTGKPSLHSNWQFFVAPCSCRSSYTERMSHFAFTTVGGKVRALPLRSMH